jgi:hypothetical protein
MLRFHLRAFVVPHVSTVTSFFFDVTFLVLLVNNSEYSKSTGAKPILSRGCIYLVSPGALRAPTPLRPLFVGEGSTKKKENRVRRRWRLDMFASAWAVLGWRLVRVAHVF